MLLVHERKDRPGAWEVGWTWLPFFLAADAPLIRMVDQLLTEEYKGSDLPVEQLTTLMHGTVIDTIIKHYPIKGLREYLEAILKVEP